MYARTDKGATLALIPKAGMQSMRHVLRPDRVLTIEEVRHDPVRIVFLREPIARLISAYRFFRTIYEWGSHPSPSDPKPHDVESWDAFIAFVRVHDNVHWRPQVEVLREFAPTAVHRFERVDLHWHTYHSVPFPHLNASRPFEAGEVPSDIAERYSEELAIWHGL